MRELQMRPELLMGNTPFVLTDATEGWRAMRDWTNSDFFPSVLPCSLGQKEGCGTTLFRTAEHFFDGGTIRSILSGLLFGPDSITCVLRS